MNKAFFGYKQIDSNDKQGLVNKVFSSVATKYDLMNDVMSFGIHRIWKQKMLDEIKDFSKKCLDVAGGTGDIALKFYNRAKENNHSPDIVIFDINQEMLTQGRMKFLDKGVIKGVSWICGNAEEIPFSDNSFDYYTCAFGIRNMTNLPKVLSEANRVLKPGGKFICMEFSHISNDILSNIYNIYSIKLIPFLGDLIANDRESYQYLVESIQKFPTQKEFAKMIREANFKDVRYQNLTGGICAIHTGYK